MRNMPNVVEFESISAMGLEVCGKIAIGKSVASACRDMKIGCETFFKELRINKALQEEYARAREARADARFENLDEIFDQMKQGLIDPMTAKVLMDGIKWQCGKEKAKVYGDSTTIKGDADNPLTVKALSSALDDRVKARIEHKE